MPGHSSGGVLRVADAVAAIIVLDDGRYLLQHRDDIPGIWFPGHWGCFGGAIDAGESPLDALKRELSEEVDWELREAAYFTRFDFDLGGIGLGSYFRIYYVVPMASTAIARLVLREGQGFAAFRGDDALGTLRVTPYDAFALFLHHARDRITAPTQT